MKYSVHQRHSSSAWCLRRSDEQHPSVPCGHCSLSDSLTSIEPDAGPGHLGPLTSLIPVSLGYGPCLFYIKHNQWVRPIKTHQENKESGKALTPTLLFGTAQSGYFNLLTSSLSRPPLTATYKQECIYHKANKAAVFRGRCCPQAEGQSMCIV